MPDGSGGRISDVWPRNISIFGVFLGLEYIFQIAVDVRASIFLGSLAKLIPFNACLNHRYLEERVAEKPPESKEEVFDFEDDGSKKHDFYSKDFRWCSDR